LESVCWGNSTVGSNPTLSAILAKASDGRRYDVWYVYILKSRADNKLYVGSTNDLKRRLREHSDGTCESTRHRRPFELEAYIAVRDEAVARSLEKYLNSGSGIATLKKRISTSEVRRM
jgi:putative endonuclease